MKSVVDMPPTRASSIRPVLTLHREADDRKLLLHVHVRLEEGPQETYYLARPATRITKTVAKASWPRPLVPVEPKAEVSDADKVACSLENPESCESCQ